MRLTKSQFQHLEDIMAGRVFSPRTGEKVEGFSIKAFGPRAGAEAGPGFLVGIKGNSRDFDSNPTAQEVEDYTNEHEAVLSEPHMYLGGWGGQQPPRASLDTSVRHEKTTKGLSQSRFAAARYNQEGIGETGLNEHGEVGYVTTHYNPHYMPGESQKGRDLTRAERSWAIEPLVPKKPKSSKQPNNTQRPTRPGRVL